MEVKYQNNKDVGFKCKHVKQLQNEKKCIKFKVDVVEIVNKNSKVNFILQQGFNS